MTRSATIASYSTFVFLFFWASPMYGQDPDWGPAPGSSPTYSIVYTGRLFGYFRYPEEQSSRQSGCPAFSESLASPQVRQFRSTLERLHQQANSPSVLVSLGDNFAPEYLARAMRDQTSHDSHFGRMVMKDLFSADSAGEHWESDWDHPPSEELLRRGKVPSDNVACFMRLTGIEAAVPGQEDFYFGPDRVRELARFLAEPPDSVYKPVQMLAANLSVVSSVRRPAPPTPNDILPAPIRRALQTPTPVRIDLPVVVMPWLQTVSVTSPDPAPLVYDCLASPENPRDFPLPSDPENACTPLTRSGQTSHAYRFAKPLHPSTNFLSYYTLDPGTNHALCVAYQEKEQPALSCRLFSVQYPFFQFRPDSSGTTPAPYALSPPPAGSTGPGIAIFGVLDPSLIGFIGQFNSTYLNVNRDFDTKLQITDPVEALRQILGLCAADPSCRRARKVLLAQMPFYKTLQLATQTEGFDLVLAQADFEHATEQANSSRPFSRSSQPYVLAPGFSFDSSRNPALNINLRQASVYLATQPEEGQTWEYLATRSYNTPVPPASHSDEAGGALETATARTVQGTTTMATSDTATQNYERLALASLQQFCGSDIALLQHRDIFSAFSQAIAYWPAGRDYGLQQWLDEVLWKGDFAFCLPVKGSTLKKMLQDSALYDQQDRDRLSLVLERGRGLSTLGISKDPSSNLPVSGGQVIDDNKLYGVAMTDYLAFGDTGYPELSAEAILPRVHVTSLGTLHRVAGLACEHLENTAPDDCSEREEIPSSDYFDTIVLPPFDTSPGLSAAQQFRRWVTAPLRPPPVPATLLAGHRPTLESAVERRGTWWLTLQNLSAEYHLAFLRGSAQTIPANFSGINTFSQLSTPESSRVGFWTRVRGGYLFPRFIDFYASGEERFTYAKVRISSTNGDSNFGPYQPALADNAVRTELGLLSKPISRGLPVRALLSENLLTQVTSPFLVLSLPTSCSVPGCASGTTTLQSFDLAKNYLVMTRLGARLQGRENWFEVGRQYGKNIDIPLGYTLHDVGRSQPFSCTLSGNLSLSQCISSDPLFTTQSKIVPDLHNQSMAGWFLDFHTMVPLYLSNLRLTIDSYGEKFDKRPDDTSFNTRYYEDLNVALKIPIWGNLTFAPQVELFLYQNKVVPGQALLTNHYTFVTSSLQLEYGFDWHRGVGWRRALRYPGRVSSATSPNAPAP